MKIQALLIALHVHPFISFCQKLIVPGSPDIKTSYITPEKSLYTVYYVKDTTWTKKGSFTNDISFKNNEFVLHYQYTDKEEGWVNKRTSVADAKTLRPISYSADGTKSRLNLRFGETVTGDYFSKKTNENKSLNLQVAGKFVDYNMTNQIFSTLPLDVGYKGVIPLFYYDSEAEVFIDNFIITEVKSYVYWSMKTGNHNAWLITTKEESSGGTYIYIVDKKDRRLWQREMSLGGGMWEICVNEELDYQPIKSSFDKDATIQQINKGNSVIVGVAYAREDTGKRLGGLVNTARKQYAPRGTEITLFPSSAYYEEWVAVNKKIKKEKKMPEVLLNPDFAYGIKKTKVYDDEGHFEFLDLMPGSYIVLASFDFTNSYHYSYVTGQTNYYNYYGYAGSKTHYDSAKQQYRAQANIEKRVTIDRDGEKKEVSLKEK